MRDFLLRPAVRYSLAGVALLALVLGAVWMTRTPPVPSPSVSAEPDDSQSPVPAATRRRIDQWLAETKRNRYGDPLTANYRGGTPLFDSATGKYKDRYLYILERHPELKDGQ